MLVPAKVPTELPTQPVEETTQWSVKILGYNVPYWFILIIVVIVVYGVYKYLKNKKASQPVQLAPGVLETPVATSRPGALSMLGSTSSVATTELLPAATSASVSSADSAQVRATLRDLFNSF